VETDMTPTEMAEFRALLDALCEETITPEQLRQLEQLVLAHPEAEAQYVQYLQMVADLARHFGGGTRKVLGPAGSSTENGPRPLAPQPSLARRRWLLWGSVGFLALAASLLLALGIDWQPSVQDPGTPAVAEQDEPTDNTVALLVRASGAEWEQTDLPTRVGSALPPGVLKLKSGGAQLEFYSGAIVILEGPAEIHLLSRSEAYCARGKLRATVPPQAKGFKISSARLSLVETSSEFGLDVGQGDRTEVHVFQGKVELAESGPNGQAGKMKELTIGQSVRLDEAGFVSLIEPNPGKFLRAEELTARSQEEIKSRHKDWLAACEVLRKDKDLEIFYRFGAKQLPDQKVPDLSGKEKQARDGAVVGCSWTDGRWPGTKALQFKNVGDRVRFHGPGEFKSLTMLAWVRPERLPNQFNSLMMSDGWERGTTHWQIGSDGRLGLGVNQGGKRPSGYPARNAVPPRLLGQWLHLAVVYNQPEGKVTHYLNGKQVAKLPIRVDVPLVIGNAELGNWNVGMHMNNAPVRFFTGCMDEFMLFSRPFAGDEIERLCGQSQCEP